MIKNTKIAGAVVFIPLLISALALTLAGCQTALGKQNAAAKKFNEQRNRIYEAYLAADVDHARQDLLDFAALGETERHISPRAQASHLLRTYGWLCVFEERTGDKQLADVYFEKAKYRKIREKELDGDTDSEIGSKLSAFTREKIISDVDEWDKGASNGKGPYYLEQIESQKKVSKLGNNLRVSKSARAPRVVDCSLLIIHR